jgi:hypothetical protein
MRKPDRPRMLRQVCFNLQELRQQTQGYGGVEIRTTSICLCRSGFKNMLMSPLSTGERSGRRKKGACAGIKVLTYIETTSGIREPSA